MSKMIDNLFKTKYFLKPLDSLLIIQHMIRKAFFLILVAHHFFEVYLTAHFTMLRIRIESLLIPSCFQR